MELVNPPELGRPRGFSHGVVAPAGRRLLFVAGQTGADAEGRVAADGFAAEFEAALGKVIQVVRGAGGSAAGIARMTVFVTDLQAYRSSRPLLREIWTRVMGGHYPAMAVIEVSGLVDAEATIEIQADAVLP